MAHTMTHTTLKNDAKEVTGYTIKADGTDVGHAVKDKGKFNFTPAWPEGKPIEGAKTMRDLKSEVEKAVPAGFVKANAPAPKEKSAKADAPKPTEEQEAAEREAIEAATDGESEDIDLD